MEKEKIVFSWSGGKDSSLALHDIRQSGRYEVVSLLTTVTEGYDRICMHGVRRELLDRQAEAVGIPCHPIYMSQVSSNQEFEEKLTKALLHFKAQGIRKIAFGDIFLEDLKKYRDDLLARIGMEGVYPIWRQDSRGLVERFIQTGFKAFLVCVNTAVLDASFAGRMIDADLLRDLPPAVDPCGENGEFHSYVFDGPLFNREVKIKRGERVIRGPFAYCDLISEEAATVSG